MIVDKKLHQLSSKLKDKERLEVRKNNSADMNTALQIVLNFDSAFYGVGVLNKGSYGGGARPQTMDNGNFEGDGHYHGKSLEDNMKRKFLNGTPAYQAMRVSLAMGKVVDSGTMVTAR